MIEPWMGLFVLCFSGHAFGLGFFLGTRYVTTIATPQPAGWRPQWLQTAIDAYQRSHRRPLSADELTEYDWDSREKRER